MRVYKFGGASVKDANAIRNLRSIIEKHADCKLIVVISAMDKTTNAFELLHGYHYSGDERMTEQFEKICDFHRLVCNQLFSSENDRKALFLNDCFDEIKSIMNKPASANYDFGYDRLVCYGELLSTKIIYRYLSESNQNISFLDIRKLIRTNNTYREARVDWEYSAAMTSKYFNNNNTDITITQGFIGSTSEGLTTTLGREGSDFTAAILAFLLNAEDVTIWKDVPGIMNADPVWYKNPEKIDVISYQEAIELAFYGAKVIHPRTVKPLENKKIPLLVKSFIKPDDTGTCITHTQAYVHYPPIYILKHGQLLLSILPKDFSFIAEDNLSTIFAIFDRYRTHVNLIQNSAISFSACTDINTNTYRAMIEELQKDFVVKYNENLTLVTIRHYNDEAIQKIISGKTILLEQKSRSTVRYVIH